MRFDVSRRTPSAQEIGFSSILIHAKNNYVFTIDGVKQKLSLHKKEVTLKENQWGCDKAVGRKKAESPTFGALTLLFFVDGRKIRCMMVFGPDKRATEILRIWRQHHGIEQFWRNLKSIVGLSLDIYVSNYSAQANILYRNNGNDNNWLHVKTIGTISNRDGIGARIHVKTGLISQIREVGIGSGYLPQNSLPVEFGLGAYTQADIVEVRWPSGIVQTLTNVPANQMIEVVEPAQPPIGAKILFVSERSGNRDIWVMNADGSQAIQLTTNPGVDDMPVCSPDGTKIVYISDNAAGKTDIWIMNADGSGKIQLTNSPADDQLPNWSPDGTEIVFIRKPNRNVWKVKTDGSGEYQLTDSYYVMKAKWQPNGTKILYDEDTGGAGWWSMWVMNSDGSGKTRLTTALHSVNGRWRHDGQKIVTICLNAYIARFGVRYNKKVLNSYRRHNQQLN